jgi:hypothetical protein
MSARSASPIIGNVVAILACLYLLVGLKWVATLSAIRWVFFHGTEYRDLVAELPSMTIEEHDEILDKCGGVCFPFGKKEYKLSRYIRNCKGAKRWALDFFRKYLFQFPGPALAGSFLLVLTAKSPASVALISGRAYGWLGVGYCALMMVEVLTLSAEAFVSYAILGSYGAAWHRLDTPRQRLRPGARERRSARSRPDIPIVTEMIAYFGILITGYLIMICAVYFGSVRLAVFTNIPGSHGGGLIQGGALFDSLYWTTLMPTDFNDTGPVGVLPRVLVLLGFFTIFVMVTFVVFILGVASSSRRDIPPGDSRPSAPDNAQQATQFPASTRQQAAAGDDRSDHRAELRIPSPAEPVHEAARLGREPDASEAP